MASIRIWKFLALIATFVSADLTYNTPTFQVQLADDSGVLKSLRPISAPDFDFSPLDRFDLRNNNGNYHVGDLTLSFRKDNSSSWRAFDTSLRRNQTSASRHLSVDQVQTNLNSALSGNRLPVNVTRTWASVDGDISLHFHVQNIDTTPITIGALGMPIEFNNIFTNRTAVETTQKCVLVDPFIGLHAGYAQVTRLTGTGPNLVITPLTSETKMEAWRFLEEPWNPELPYQQQTFEGNYAWDVFTGAFAETSWSNAIPWNPPTSRSLQPGEAVEVGLRFSIASQLHDIESKLAAVGSPVAVGIPGYVLPADIEGSLFLNTTNLVKSLVIDPPGSLNVSARPDVQGWKSYAVQVGEDAFGRARVAIEFDNGRTMAVSYFTAAESSTTLSRLSRFLTTQQWYTDSADIFNRSPSIISYDHEAQKPVLQDNRAWIAGLSDEGGAGSFLAAAMKQAFSPNLNEIAKLESFVNDTVWGDLQISEGPQKFGVRKSLFFYEPDLVTGYQYDQAIDWRGAWNKAAAFDLGRAYDYVHVSNLYWSLYKAGRTHDVLSIQEPDWYLLQSYNTVMFVYGVDASGDPNTAYGDLGLMGEWVWSQLLVSLWDEGYINEADSFEALMRSRQEVWAMQEDPFGSEMAWDSTGEEGVYLWSDYFSDNSTAQKTLQAIRGYTPTVPHWGYNGNSRRYWDFLYGGKYPGIERQIHHYGSGLNALPLLSSYRKDQPNPASPQAWYDLRVAYGGNYGPLSNIHQDGFASMAFHSEADKLYWDPYTGDYGPNFVGHALGVGTYLVHHDVFGWVAFGGNVEVGDDGASVTLTPKDTLRKRVFIADAGLYITVDAGIIEQVRIDVDDTNTVAQVTVELNPIDGDGAPVCNATISIETSGKIKGGQVELSKPWRLVPTRGNPNTITRYTIPFLGDGSQLSVIMTVV